MQVGNQGNRFAALESGQVQVTTLLPPVSSRAENAGYPKLAELPKLAPDYLSIGPVMSMKTLNARRPVVKRFLMALAEATAAYQKDKEGGVAAIQKYLKIANEKDAELAWAYYSPLNSVTPAPQRSINSVHPGSVHRSQGKDSQAGGIHGLDADRRTR